VDYSHPIRLFVLTSIALFAITSFKGLSFTFLDVGASETWKNAEKSIHFEEFKETIDSISNELKMEQPNSKAINALDSLENRLPENLDSGTFNFETNGKEWNFRAKDIVQLKEEDILEKYEIEGFLTQTIIRQFIRMLKNSSGLANFIWSNVPIMLLIMMPGVAFLLKLFYFRRDYYFVEHLVFSFHIHAFLFLLIGLLLLLPFTSVVSVLYGLSILGFLVYLYFAFKNFYGQSSLKTIIKLFGVGIGYTLILLIAIILTFFISLLIF